MRTSRREEVAVLLGAVALDLLIGEPPSAVHPVVAIGGAVVALERRVPRSHAGQLVYGAIIAAGLPLAIAGIARATDRLLKRLPPPLRVVALSFALKPSFAIRSLLEAGRLVQADLSAGDVEGARGHSAALVSRDTSMLGISHLRAAAIESLTENLTDSVVAPLLAYCVAGLPGAYWYRCVNTLDSMIGYRGRFEWIGKTAARLDDLANFIPARISAGLLIVSAPFIGGSSTQGLRLLLEDRRRTESPNAGWTMAAAAGSLGVRLEKQGQYVLNRNGREPGPSDIATARLLVAVASTASVLLAAVLILRRPLRSNVCG